MVQISVPSEMRKEEYMFDGTVEIEKFISDGQIFQENEIEMLFAKFSD